MDALFNLIAKLDGIQKVLFWGIVFFGIFKLYMAALDKSLTPDTQGAWLVVVWLQKPHCQPEPYFIARYKDSGKAQVSLARYLFKITNPQAKPALVTPETGIYCKVVQIPADQLEQEPVLPPFEGAKVHRPVNNGFILDKPLN